MTNLIRLIIKLSFFPSALLIVSKLSGIVLAINLFGLDFLIDHNPESIGSIRLMFYSQSDTILVNSLSNFVMIFSVLVFAIFYLSRFFANRAIHTSSQTLVKVVRLNILPLLNTKEPHFLKALIWTLYLWICLILSISSTITGEAYSILGIFCVILLISTIWSIILALKIEINQVYPDSNFYL